LHPYLAATESVVFFFLAETGFQSRGGRRWNGIMTSCFQSIRHINIIRGKPKNEERKKEKKKEGKEKEEIKAQK